MKANIHPNYQPTIFRCSCGNVLETFSVLGGDRHLEICAECHPFFKGNEKKMIDSAGRIEKFKRRYEAAEKKKAEVEDAKNKPARRKRA